MHCQYYCTQHTLLVSSPSLTVTVAPFSSCRNTSFWSFSSWGTRQENGTEASALRDYQQMLYTLQPNNRFREIPNLESFLSARTHLGVFQQFLVLVVSRSVAGVCNIDIYRHNNENKGIFGKKDEKNEYFLLYHTFGCWFARSHLSCSLLGYDAISRDINDTPINQMTMKLLCGSTRSKTGFVTFTTPGAPPRDLMLCICNQHAQ